MSTLTPVVLFAYARPDHLQQVLACLRENNIPLLYVFADGPKTPDVAERVNEVRKILREIDWCEVHLVERVENLGLGKSILAGIAEVFKKHETIIVFEDDIICVPGTYQYLCAALEHYKDTPNVMSVTGWTHPRTTPRNVVDQPYFDGRAECLVWGAWRRSWQGMDRDSLALIQACQTQEIDEYRYGADLVEMAGTEKIKNIWAVRFSYLHILNKGLCLRPPYSLVEHIGYDTLSSNVSKQEDYSWFVPLTRICPPIPQTWPDAVENSECPRLWQKECGSKPTLFSQASLLFQIPVRRLATKAKKLLQRL